jgi:hypothetical protein
LNTVYKQGEVLGISFLQIPYSLIINQKYKTMSAEAKLAYGLLLRRMQLSSMKGWVNADNEVYLIYTREQMAAELNVSYKKAVAAFKELTDFGLILEKRRGRGFANHIFVVKAEIPDADAKRYVSQNAHADSANAPIADNTSDNCHVDAIASADTDLRCVKMTYQEAPPTPEKTKPCEFDIAEPAEEATLEEEPDIESTEPSESTDQDLSNLHIKTCQNDISRDVETTHQDLSFLHTSYKEDSDININHTKESQSVRQRERVNNNEGGEITPMDSVILSDIFKKCELYSFKPDIAHIFKRLITRMYYSTTLRVGNAVYPQELVRNRLRFLDYDSADYACQKFKNNKQHIQNVTGYMTSVLFNAILECDGDLALDPELNALVDFAARTG